MGCCDQGNPPVIEVREEEPGDIAAIRAINERAFGQPQEAQVIDRLREVCSGLLSLVAILEGRIVGHILFSPATIEAGNRNVMGKGLAPMAVLPECQGCGIGSELVKAGIARLRDKRCPFIIVLGHEGYYPRFGFEPASKYGIQSQWQGVPDNAFMILILDEMAMKGISGIARYRSEFDEAM